MDILAACNAARARVSTMRLDVRWFETVTSTMDIVDEAARAGAAEGLVVVAHEQASGRGRRGRVWSSPPGAGLYLSFLFRPARAAGQTPALSLLTLAAGVAVHGAIAAASGLRADLKWPNDLMVGRRKLAGILAEGIGLGTHDAAVVLGVGVNISSTAHPPDIADRATSLQAELGRDVDRALLLEELLVAVAQRYDDLRRGNVDDILREWRRASPCAEGALVRWHTHDGVHHGTSMGIDDSGALLVRTAAGCERVVGGEVVWL